MRDISKCDYCMLQYCLQGTSVVAVAKDSFSSSFLNVLKVSKKIILKLSLFNLVDFERLVKNVYFVYNGSGEPFRLNWFSFVPKIAVGINKNQSQIKMVQEKGNQILNPFGDAKMPNAITFELSGKMINNPTTKSSLANTRSNTILIIKRNNN